MRRDEPAVSARAAPSRIAAGRGGRGVALGAAAAGLVAAGGLLVISAGWSAATSTGAWAKAARESHVFLVAAGITGACAAALAVLCGALCVAGRQGRDVLAARNPLSERGSATFEFALVLPIALMVVLIMVQSSLVMGGSLCVHHAAFCAARSAIVQVPRDLSADEPANVVADEGSSQKLRLIKQAAVWAVLPISCAHPDGPVAASADLENALEAVFAATAGGTPAWVRRDLAHKLGYAQRHTWIALEVATPPVAGGAPAPAGNGPFRKDDDLRVLVRHDFYLSVPYAARVFSQVAGDGMTLEFGRGLYALTMRSDCTLTNEGEQDFVDVERFP